MFLVMSFYKVKRPRFNALLDVAAAPFVLLFLLVSFLVIFASAIYYRLEKADEPMVVPGILGDVREGSRIYLSGRFYRVEKIHNEHSISIKPWRWWHSLLVHGSRGGRT
jgi:uncharacterized membrane protein YqiK